MEVKAVKTVEQEVVIDILCNQCGESLMRWCAGNENGIRACGIRASMTSAYDSPVLPDDNLRLSFALCEPCVVEIAKGFKLPMHDHTNESPWIP
jgi:hypothetical protein